MAERRTIGQILMGFGRITEEDVKRALDYQKDAGGYFGEALLALGLVTQEELEWGLASQFDLPYVFPEADSIDPEAAGLVTPEWALSHLTLPIMKTDDAVTVIVDSPIKTDAVDELQHRTGLRIELALASAGKIRELVRQIYSRVGKDELAEGHAPISLDTLFTEALERGATRFGISVRGRRVTGWFDDRGTSFRRHLTSGWGAALDGAMTPSPTNQIEVGVWRWSGAMEREGASIPVEVRVLTSPAGTEYLIRPVEADTRLHERFHPPPQGILSEVRLLARSGTARFAVTTTPESLAEAILPYLPALLLEPSWRSVHVGGEGEPPEDVFMVVLPTDPEGRAGAIGDLRAFHFDALTAHLPGDPEEWAPEVLDLAGAAFLAWSGEADRRVADRIGIRWELRIEGGEGGRFEWSLLPLK